MKHLLPLLLLAFAQPVFGQTAEIQSLANMKRDLYYLASDECEGRGPGTKGLDKAADYIAKQLQAAGLKPAGKDGYFQPFTITGQSELGKPNAVSFKGPDNKTTDLELDKTFQVLGLSGKGKVEAPLVFVGYGIQSLPNKLDEYVGIETAGKIVVMIRRVPRFNAKEPFGGMERDALASLENKIRTAVAAKAAGVILVNDVGEKDDVIPPFSYLATGSPTSIPCVQVKREAIEPIIEASLGKKLADIEKAIDEDLKPQSAPLKGWKASLETTVARAAIPVKNVIAVSEGKGPLAKEIVVVGAHYDHLGWGGQGSRSPKEKAIHHGADDNGSGTTAMLELARRFGEQKDREGRTLVFMAFSAEERGLLGSSHYCEKEPLHPLADIAVMVNLDMVGKMRPDAESKQDKLIVQGTAASKTLGKLVDDLNKPNFKFVKTPGAVGPSDHTSFYMKKIPVLFFWTGDHPDYHKPSDTADKINYEGMQKIVDYVETVVARLTTDKERPDYIYIPPQSAKGGGPKLGVMPDYAADKEGLLIGAVAAGGAAEAAGLKAGDLIVEIAGKKVADVYAYTSIMASQKAGVPIEMTVIRGKETLKIKATPK